MYELFILGELLDQDLHGYLLRDIINRTIGPTRQLSWGALYPLLRKMQEDELIEQLQEAGTTGRLRKVYRLTPKGRTRFFDLMRQPADYDSDYPDLFHIKLVNFDHLTPEEQRIILQHYQGYVRFVGEQLQASRHYVAGNTSIPSPEQRFVLLALDHRLQLNKADLTWIEMLLQ